MFIAFTQELCYDHFAIADTKSKAINRLVKEVRNCSMAHWGKVKVAMDSDDEMKITHSGMADFYPSVHCFEVTDKGIDGNMQGFWFSA